MIVRKAILNEPKRYGFELFLVSVSSFVGFGYFWASKVTKKIGVRELLCRFGFGYFWALKVTKRMQSNCIPKMRKPFQMKIGWFRDLSFLKVTLERLMKRRFVHLSLIMSLNPSYCYSFFVLCSLFSTFVDFILLNINIYLYEIVSRKNSLDHWGIQRDR